MYKRGIVVLICIPLNQALASIRVDDEWAEVARTQKLLLWRFSLGCQLMSRRGEGGGDGEGRRWGMGRGIMGRGRIGRGRIGRGRDGERGNGKRGNGERGMGEGGWREENKYFNFVEILVWKLQFFKTHFYRTARNKRRLLIFSVTF